MIFVYSVTIWPQNQTPSLKDPLIFAERHPFTQLTVVEAAPIGGSLQGHVTVRFTLTLNFRGDGFQRHQQVKCV